MDSMLGENKNLKDTSRDSIKDSAQKSFSYGVGTSLTMPSFLTYNKTNKLITALYMVTDTMEKEEPMRLKLRTLGVEILSDIITMSKVGFDIRKIDQTLSFLNIAFDIKMISEMNCNILKKEFIELKQSIQEFTAQNNLWFEEFISKPPLLDEGGVEGGNSKITTSSFGHPSLLRRREFSKGQGTRLGVQKGSTLMDALNKVGHAENFQILKDKRRELIIKIIKNKSEGMSIKDISFAVQNLEEKIGEKTLQRELISMVKDNVLKKTGEKRWSLYFIN